MPGPRNREDDDGLLEWPSKRIRKECVPCLAVRADRQLRFVTVHACLLQSVWKGRSDEGGGPQLHGEHKLSLQG